MLGSLLSRPTSILVAAFFIFWSQGDGWAVVPATLAFSIHHQHDPTWAAVVVSRKGATRAGCPADSITTALHAVNTPKRRKRKTSPNDESGDDDSLPDFDIADDSSTTVSSSTNDSVVGSSTSTTTTSKPTSPDVISFNEITPEMMGSWYAKKETTVGDLLRDRSLESKFQFDDEDADDSTLPDLTAVFPTNTASFSEPLGNKKKARKAARIAAAAAAQRKKEEEEEGNILSKIPYIRDEKGEVSALKILENGTWLGIGLLVAWEIYINSPFFDRAQPMIPIVYDIVWFM